MLLATVAIIFAVLILLSMPIVFSLAVAGIAGLWLGGYPMQPLSSALVSGSQSWVLLAIPAFVFAGNLMERCGMSHALVELARALVGWVRGGLGMSVIVVAYFFSDICGSKKAESPALGSSLMPPLTRAGYDRRDSASLIAAGTAMGMLVPPAIFMIVIAQVTNTSAVALFVAGFIPAVVIMLCLMAVVYIRARQNDWPVDTRPSLKRLGHAALHAAVPMVVPFVILAGFIPRHHHRDRGRRRGRGLRLPRRQALLPQCLLARDGQDRLRQRDPHRRGGVPARGRLGLSIPDGRERSATVAWPGARAAESAPVAVPDRNRCHELPVRHGAGGPTRRGRAHSRGVSNRRNDGHRSDPLPHRADRGGRHRPVPAADGRRAINGAALRQPERRAALPYLCALYACAVCRAAAHHLHPGDQPDAAEAGGADQIRRHAEAAATHDSPRPPKKRAKRKARLHFICPSSLAAPLPFFDISRNASRPPAA